MKPEQLDTYVIPPNFIEGGTLFGGLFKTRNAVEAAILGAAVGLPVFHVGLSLTTRIIILCVTALPLMLFALIGVGGMSLSTFALLLIQYFRNRRLLTRNAEENNKKGSTILPNWGRQKPETETADPLPKSRNRYQVDLKDRKLNQYKVFISEETMPPLNALAEYIPIEKIVNMEIRKVDKSVDELLDGPGIEKSLLAAKIQRLHIFFLAADSRHDPRGTATFG